MGLKQYDKCENCSNYSKLEFMGKIVATCTVNMLPEKCILIKGENKNVKY